MCKVPSQRIPRIPEKAMGINQRVNGPFCGSEWAQGLLLEGDLVSWPPQETFVKQQLCEGLLCPDPSAGWWENHRPRGHWCGRQRGQGCVGRAAVGPAPSQEGPGCLSLSLPAQPGGRDWGSHSLLLLCSPSRRKRQSSFNGVHDLDWLRPVYKNSILHILTCTEG